ncbi:glycosyltransferase family 4 protein [Usitatibacter palustris]|uniref:N, N'-diacetylbacillosaminyl-diphospho-undecaprenol alpha-1,3-N-acetylgalactosaminyltransferase n=1 Tax=Usitatibacter palustris TaxID=2732487 RepID=A0A6M4H7Y2_9PROT|nr:glycosyltransferase family 4 protein [Usitatibacter palustris]QJR15680.1 N,N'-diacetylbacillosaminyl-diphospho-undecaprenol alpha-1,3-N-acetylgalactosaminyltransferase [Usitatibacter palustris]
MDPRTPPAVALVSNTSWSLYNFRRPVIETLLARGCRVIALAPRDAYSERLVGLGCEYIEVPIDAKGTNPLRDARAIFDFLRAFRRTRPAFAFNYTIKCSIYATLAGQACGVRCVPVITGAGYAFAKQGWIAGFARQLYRLALRRVEYAWFLNEDDRALFVAQGLLPEGKARILPGGEGVDLQAFDARRASRPAPDSGPFTFLLVARMLWEKGVREFVEAARIVRARLPGTRFQLLGATGVDNPSAIPREQIAAWEREGVIEYLGTTDDVAGAMLASSAVVLPSYYREGIPRVLLEAASLGLPVITTDNVGCRDTVEDGRTGFVVRPRDCADLAAKMVALAAMAPGERRAMGQRGREKMEREFDVRRVVATYVAAIGLPEVAPR